MTRPVTAQDREDDSVMGILKRIEASANRGSWYTRSGAGVLIEIRDWASDAIAKIEAMSTLDGQSR